jgi:plastocyanin
MRRITTYALVLGGTLAAMSCGGGGAATPTTPTSPTVPSGVVTINITGLGGQKQYDPNPATVAAGQTVVFKNNDLVTHHIALDDGTGQTADILPGTSSAAMTIGGNKSYHCVIHPFLVGGFNGTDVVEPPGCSGQYCFGGGD